MLGAHQFSIGDKTGTVIRTWIKDAEKISVRALADSAYTFGPSNAWIEMDRRSDWLFQKAFTCADLKGGQTDGELPPYTPKLYYELKVTYQGDATMQEHIIRDTYSFASVINDGDLKLFQSGSCWHVDNLMGSHLINAEGADGVRFVVWAPHAVFVSLVGDWNQWDGRAHPMRKQLEYGVWELFVPHIGIGQKYGYKIHARDGRDFIKIDPYAQEFENPPAHASVISGCDDAYRCEEDRFVWTDAEWLKQRSDLAKTDMHRRQPISIYEVHLPSWMRGDGNRYLGYRELADRLSEHCKKLNFTHVEFLPLAHHPFEGSWGYQVSGLYAPYSRLGDADDLKYLINKLHEDGIGVFLDYVPAHFVKDDWGLVHFDGEACYEYSDPREGEHRGWGTMVFNFRRNEVRSFLLGAAYHWLRRYHIDGLRIDAVSSMLYKNYCREEGDWIPNEFGGDANLQAITLVQELNWVIHREFPGVLTMAEESTSWQGVTDQDKGLGFDFKWDLGWMNDVLSYTCTPVMDRHTKHNKLTFRGLYMAHEKWVLPLSHDEVVSGKGSLLDKCGYTGAPFVDRLKTLRTLFGLQVGSPGRPLIFMGSEFGQGAEWSESQSLDWHEAAERDREKVMLWLSDLLGVYKYHKALHAGDDESWNFQWVDCDNNQDNIVGWLRKYQDWHNDILVICNFSGVNYHRYPVGVPHGGEWEVLLNSDDWRYGGAMHGPGNLKRMWTTQGGRAGWPCEKADHDQVGRTRRLGVCALGRWM
eukprot:GHVO01051619.1.p1 GENE.GHVO01051619.1~~GHVO01051619.1.p1  ORF type:complete len:755 (+),score=131.46 GHVO01051619.1:88-2352(+)